MNQAIRVRQIQLRLEQASKDPWHMAEAGRVGAWPVFRVFPLQVGENGAMFCQDAQLIEKAREDIQFLLDCLLKEKADAKD